MVPSQRIKTFTLTAGTMGLVSGFYDGIKISSLRFLVENSHRLPRTVGAWYLYHKKKNYVMVLGGSRAACILALKFLGMVGTFFTLECIIDRYVRKNTIDFANTTAAAGIISATYAAYTHASRAAIFQTIKRGSLFGLSLGFTQDMLILARGGNVWYLNMLGIRIPREENTKLQ